MKKSKKKSDTGLPVLRVKAYNAAVDGKRIKAVRKAAGLTQLAAAKRLAWTVQRWSDLENGRHPNPRIGTLLAVCAVLGCKIGDLLR